MGSIQATYLGFNILRVSLMSNIIGLGELSCEISHRRVNIENQI